MTKPTDNKTRKNILDAKQRGETRKTIAMWLNISISTVDKVWKRFKDTGSIEPIPYKGRKSKITSDQEDNIKATIAEIPDITLDELIEKLSLPLNRSGLSKKIRKMGISFKKRHSFHLHKNDQTYSKKEIYGNKTNQI